MKKIKVKQTTWNLKPFFRSDNDPQITEQRKIVEKESYKFIKKWRNRSDYLTNSKVLKQALDEYEKWQRHYGTCGNEDAYFSLRIEQDQENSFLKAGLNKMRDFSNKIENDIQFFTLNIAKIHPDNQKKFLNHKELKNYKHFLERIFAESKYLLTEPEEKILNLKSATSYSNWVRMTSEFLSKEERAVFSESGKKEIKNFSEILNLLNDKKKKIRDSAVLAFNDILEKNSAVAEAEMNSILKDKETNDKLRGAQTPQTLRYISDDVNGKIVNPLIETIENRFNISKKYYKLKAGLFGVKTLQYHERNIEYGNVKKEYKYEEAVNLVYNIFSGLDKEFADIFSGYVKNGQIDVFPKKGKRSGAFCTVGLISQPTYVFLNHTNKLWDVLTIAHETGHGINNELTREKQNNALNFGAPHFSAEVASTFMEDFVFEKILQEADDRLRLSVLIMKLDEDVSAVFRQAALYRFEEDLHSQFREKGHLSKETIGKLFQKRMRSYMGNFVEQSPGSENWWIYVSHLRNFFYNYQYASGILIAKSFQNSFRNDSKFIESVKEFLGAGLSDYPKNMFGKIGVDIEDKEFWNRGVDGIEKLLNETIKLAKKLGKI